MAINAIGSWVMYVSEGGVDCRLCVVSMAELLDWTSSRGRFLPPVEFALEWGLALANRVEMSLRADSNPFLVRN